jgi:putative ABC transport system substrate-binding protein
VVVAGDPVGSGLVASLARPGGNVTGLSNVSVDLSAKQLQLLKETVPKASRVAVLSNPANPFHALAVKEVEVASRSLGVPLQILAVRGPDEFDSAFAPMTRARAGALLVLPGAMFFVHRTRLADVAAKNRLPEMHGLTIPQSILVRADQVIQ